MISDLVVIDNFFNQEELCDILKDAREFDYWDSNEHPSKTKDICFNWDGVRSKNLLEINYDRYSSVVNKTIITSIKQSFGENSAQFNFKWDCTLYFHKLNTQFKEQWMHKDDNTLFAGVIYLNESSPPDSGTTIITKNGLVNVENKFNRLVIYNGNDFHTPSNGFDDRLTISIFISSFLLSFWNELPRL
jgi:hypothetical protein